MHALYWIILLLGATQSISLVATQEKGLFPSVFNLAANAIISANATCGETTSEIYCKLVEHVFMGEPQCGLCDARSENPDHRHPIINAIDGTNRWWQSPTLQNGKNFEWVTVTLDLQQIFQVAYVIVKTATSPRPGNWILEHSRDGLFYKPWQYYAISDAECWEAYGIPPTVGQPRYRSDAEIICTSYYSKLNPLENAEIHTSLVNGRPGAEGPSDTLREFTTARYVRLRLQKIRTLNADLMTLQTDDPRKTDKSTSRRYFYSVKDISIGGQCVCHGHASYCPVNFETNVLQCKCEHNTCGENCEQCCPLYQQQLWRPGTNNDGAACEKCQCFGHAEICFYDQTVADKKASLNIDGDYEGGGVCIKCRHHTTGINCEQCEDGYYRPLGVKRDFPDPCRRCQCPGPGVTGFCFKDDSYIEEGVQPGDCICKIGFAGSKCDRCASGYKNYPNCEPCPCNPSGTEGGTTCEGSCVCKRNVEGVRCDVCKAGHYNLDPQNPDGCTPCYCSGITKQCQPSNWGVLLVSSMRGWMISDLRGYHIFPPTIEDDSTVMISNDDIRGVDVYYWSAPPEYLGKKLYSYGGELRYVLSYSVMGDDDQVSKQKTPGILIEGDNTRIGHYFGSRQIRGNISVVLPLQERVWFLVTAAGKRSKAVSRADFSRIINNITRLLIRAKYHSDQVLGVLYNVEMEVANLDSKSLKRTSSVEKCVCPLGYAGLACEVCEPGYRRVNNILHKGVCELCLCNNHAYSCDPHTGHCLDCQHNSTGLFCQQCKLGFHGDPTHGTAEDCNYCACPLTNSENNFSPDCEDVVLPDGSTDYTCLYCEKGYTGSKCERCDSGYFGQPGVPDGYCQPCNCTGNENSTDPYYCDHITGKCLNCIGYTGGWNCNECLVGHYGNAYHHDCRPCECSPVGAESSICDPANGVCDCHMNFVGKKCDRCVDGYGNVELNCVPCNCNTTGSTAWKCDPVSGQCPCKVGVFGLKCDTCLEGYYRFSDNGCKWCGCDVNGAVSLQCEEGTGRCVCKENVTGKTCNECVPGHWNLLSGEGCEDCKCNLLGSTSPLCDELHGQCTCQSGVGGDKCDQCLPGYYGLSETGCKKCEPCKNTGHICNATTGYCICPPLTKGDYCQYCEGFAFGYDAVRGCQRCDCNKKGSPSDVCDVDNGNCLCLEGYEGRRCDKCRFAHYNFTHCTKCECRHDGTERSQCSSEGLCQCDDKGFCPCKVNVEGKKCDHCKIGTFGMTLDNPKGCFECFCFNRAKICEQAQMVWSQVRTPAREVHFELGNTRISTLNNFLLIPGRTGNVKLGIPYIIEQPLYWMLPQEFLGEKIKSYNGILQFQIESPGAKRFPDPLLQKFPLVILQGSHGLVLVHSPFRPLSKRKYSVRFHQDEWRQLENLQVPLTRMVIMTALQNVQGILIRATEGADVTIARLSEVSMEVAVPISPNPASPYVAVGIELCQCPKEYTGTSCQDPGKGYYRKFVPNFTKSKDIIDLIGFAAPCPCKNRSETCDPETGHCYNCRENTAGAFCEMCAKGFFGDPAGLNPCQPCACPLVTNSFSDTCEGDINDHACTNCQKGYEGKNCERCSRGYYGNPMIQGNTCEPCNCNSYGSLDRICDRMTGQCHCRKGISGRDCTHCQSRHILTELGCKSCDDDCTKPLLDDVYFLTEMAKKHNISNFVAPPWISLLSFDNQILQLQKSVTKYHNDLSSALNISQAFMFQFEFENLADFMHLRGRDINIKAGPLAFDALETKEEADVMVRLLEHIWKRIFGTVGQLQHENKNLTLSEKALDSKIRNGEKILENIKLRNLDDQRQEAERELRKVMNILEQVRQSIMNYELFLDKQSQLNRLTHQLSETIRLIEKNVRRQAVASSMIVEEGKQREENIYGQILKASEVHDMTNATLLDAQDLLASGKEFIHNASLVFKNFLPLKEQLENTTEQLEHHRGILARLNPRYILKFVIPAKDHAEYIAEQALYLTNLFRSTHIAAQSSLQAANVYDKVVDLIDAAEQVAVHTLNTAERAYYEVQPGRHDSLPKQAVFLKRFSSDLREESIQFMLDAQALQEALQKGTEVLNKVTLDIVNGMNSVDFVKKEINMLTRNIGDLLHDIEEEHKWTKNQMAIVKHNVTNLVFNIDTRLYSELDQIRLGSSAGLSIISKKIDNGKSIINAAIQKADATERRVEKVKRLNDEMRSSLKNLKNKILLARQKASNIRVSLSADKAGICVRSYIPDIEPSTTTSIVLNYAISTDHKDSLLFFLASSETMSRDDEPADFMIVEMVNRKIRFLWNVGNGTQVIQHNRTIETNDDQLLRNKHWYKIEIKRFGNIATLSVRPTPDGQKADPHEVTGASLAGVLKMDLDQNSFFYVGGTPKGYRVPRELKARNFAGCLYEVVLDGKKVGLWNFISSQGCSGCQEGATEEADFGAYNFKGNGYAILPQIRRYKKSSYLVTLRFKTFDEDALIFFAPNLENGDFVSLELRGGHIVYQFNLGSQSRSMLKTTKKYNTGNWTLLAAARDKLQGQLSVAGEFLEGQLPAGGPTKMELQKSLMHFGGTPPNFTNSAWSGITFQKFLGCMKDLQIDSTPLDLLKNGFFGVEASCTDTPIRSVSFRGSGYLELGSFPLLVETSFGFSFQTLQDNAVLLLSTFETGRNGEQEKKKKYWKTKDYYSVAIVNGKLEARFNGGNGESSMKSSDVVNDGTYHTFTFIKRHRRLFMYVDDTEVQPGGRLPKGSKDIGAPINRGLFLGGIREGIFPGPMIATKDFLVGTIKDVIFDDKLVNFNNPVDFKGAGIGRTLKEWIATELPYTGVTQPLERCSEMASYNTEKNASNFGDELYSHAKMQIGRKDFVHDFNVSFDIRTYYPNGLIALVKNGRGVSHFAVMLHGGRVIMDVFDRKHRRASSQIPLNDGNWHAIAITKKGRNVMLRIDKKRKGVPLKIRRRLALRSPLYIGGVPESMEPIKQVILESFKGCIRNFNLNGEHLDLARAELHSVNNCFSTIERGAFFNGAAYATYDTKFDLGVKLDIQMEFKTKRLNGVLLSLTAKSGIPSLALELYNGTVVVTVVLSQDDKPFSARRSFQSKYEMCDGQWHMVTTQYAHKAVTLKVDMYDVSYGLSENIPLEPRTSDPLYIAGFPDDAPTGAHNVRDNFLGCLRNIAINDRRVDWIDMAARHDVRPNSCPTF